jgi:hypothetical protein
MVGDVFRFPQYDDPWKGSENEGLVWKKANQGFYVNIKNSHRRQGIDDPNRNVWKEEQAVTH